MLDWKKFHIDSLCLPLYHLQSFYFAEVQRGMLGVGDYKLRKCFQSFLQDPGDARIPESYIPQEVVDIVKGRISYPKENKNDVLMQIKSETPCSIPCNVTAISKIIQEECGIKELKNTQNTRIMLCKNKI